MGEGQKVWTRTAPTITINIRMQHKAHADLARLGRSRPCGLCAMLPSPNRLPTADVSRRPLSVLRRSVVLVSKAIANCALTTVCRITDERGKKAPHCEQAGPSHGGRMNQEAKSCEDKRSSIRRHNSEFGGWFHVNDGAPGQPSQAVN
jgi:hypothetical protein